jgi:hypothetical protein
MGQGDPGGGDQAVVAAVYSGSPSSCLPYIESGLAAGEDDLLMHEVLQSDGAMLYWIAVPNFLAVTGDQ